MKWCRICDIINRTKFVLFVQISRNLFRHSSSDVNRHLLTGNREGLTQGIDIKEDSTLSLKETKIEKEEEIR